MKTHLFLAIIACLGTIAGGCKRSAAVQVMEAVANGDLSTVKEMLESNPEALSTRDKNGHTLFQLAVLNRQPQTVKFLLERRAPTDNWLGPYGSALHYAAQYGPLECVEILIQHGWSTEIVDALKETPLHIAAMNAFCPEIVLTLVEAGADVRAENLFGQTPVHVAAQCAIDEAEVAKVIDLLLRQGSDVNAVDEFGCTALDYAVEFRNRTAENILRNNGARSGPGCDSHKLEALKMLVRPSDEMTLRTFQKRYHETSRNNYLLKHTERQK